MLRGQDIVCFANDWHNDPTSKHQVMKLLSRENRILWINSIAMRKPSATASDLKRILNKLKGWSKGLDQINENLFVFTPIVLPLPSSPMARKINAWLLRQSIRYYTRKLNMNDIQLWTFVPTMVELAGQLNEKKLIYYCVDEWSKFSFMDGNSLRQMEIDLMKKADIVFVTADHLLKDKIQFNPNTHLIAHGVDHDHFSKALYQGMELPKDVREIKKPILGFFGLIHEWIDLELIEFIAKARPDWSIVMIGKVSVDDRAVRTLKNVHLLGQKAYEALPAYCKAFDVGLIPFVINDMTVNVNPIKLREYLSAGLPVVSTALPEVEKYQDIVEIAQTGDQFVTKVEAALKTDGNDVKMERSKRMESETWEQKVELLSSYVIGN